MSRLIARKPPRAKLDLSDAAPVVRERVAWLGGLRPSDAVVVETR
jgi:hypothetical protein